MRLARRAGRSVPDDDADDGVDDCLRCDACSDADADADVDANVGADVGANAAEPVCPEKALGGGDDDNEDELNGGDVVGCWTAVVRDFIGCGIFLGRFAGAYGEVGFMYHSRQISYLLLLLSFYC